jgi:hypothetical protein
MEESSLVNQRDFTESTALNYYLSPEQQYSNWKLMIKLILILSRGCSELNKCSVSGGIVISLAFGL